MFENAMLGFDALRNALEGNGHKCVTKESDPSVVALARPSPDRQAGDGEASPKVHFADQIAEVRVDHTD